MPAGSVATGFSMNTCLPARTAYFEMLRAIAGRAGEQHDIDAAFDRFAIGVEADELAFFGDVDFVADVGDSFCRSLRLLPFTRGAGLGLLAFEFALT